MAEPEYQPELLSSLIEKGELIWIPCLNCYREVEFPAKDLPLSPEIHVSGILPVIRNFLKCSGELNHWSEITEIITQPGPAHESCK